MSATPVVSELRSTPVIVVVDVVGVDLTRERVVGPEQRSGTVEVEVVEVVRGAGATAGDRLHVPVVAGAPGLWSEPLLRPGTRLVAFCDAAATGAQLLAPEHCTRLTTAEAVLADVRLVDRLQRRHLTADQLLASAEQHRAAAGALFADHVWVATRAALRTSLDRFDRLMSVAEHPGTRVEAQEAYLLAAHEDITFTGEFSAAHRARLVRAMLRAALDPRLGDRRRTLLATYLPGLVAVPEPLTAADVLAADPELRDAVVAELDDPRDPTTTSPALRAWLGEG